MFDFLNNIKNLDRTIVAFLSALTWISISKMDGRCKSIFRFMTGTTYDTFWNWCSHLILAQTTCTKKKKFNLLKIWGFGSFSLLYDY
jgi:hypothetical protein